MNISLNFVVTQNFSIDHACLVCRKCSLSNSSIIVEVTKGLSKYSNSTSTTASFFRGIK